jgi:hypothetical protein
MKKEKLPDLNLDGPARGGEPPSSVLGEDTFQGEETLQGKRDTKIFNMRISEGCKKRLELLKEDPLMMSITWNDLLEALVILLCQNGCVGEDGIKKIEKSLGKTAGIPREIKRALGVGTRWAEIGPMIEELSQETRHAWRILSQLEDALYEFATAIEASEEAEATPDFEEEPPEEDLFKPPKATDETH